MPQRLPKTRPELQDDTARKLTDGYNRQNTAAIVRGILEEYAFSSYNRAEDVLPADKIEGLAELIANTIPAGNAARVPIKCVYATTRTGANAGKAVREELAPTTLCVGAICYTQVPDTPGEEVTQLVRATTGDTNTVLVWPDGSYSGQKVTAKWAPVGSGGGAAVFPGDEPPAAISVGNIAAGFVLAGKSALAVLRQLLSEPYQLPAFASFSFGGVSGTLYLEVGTSVAGGAKSVVWSTSNPANVRPNSILLEDVTGDTELAANEANDGALTASASAFTVVAGESRRYRLSAENTNDGAFWAEVVYAGSFLVFYGPTSAPSTTSDQVRELPLNRLLVEGSPFVLNTGKARTVFEVVAPANFAVTVVDLDALSAPMPYTATAITVSDAGGTPRSYKVWRLTIADPYSSSHRHLVTLS